MRLRYEVLVVALAVLFLSACNTKDVADQIHVTTALYNDGGRVELQIGNQGDETVFLNSFSVTAVDDGEVLFTEAKYDGWFPLPLNPNGKWEFHHDGDAGVRYRALVSVSLGSNQQSIVVEQTERE